jgi:hypothetical protein
MDPGKNVNIKLFENRIVEKGVFDINILYKNIRACFTDNRYTIIERENTTKHKSRGIEILLKFTGEKRVTSFYLYEVRVDFLILGIKKVKYKNKMLDHGILEVRELVTLKMDYLKKWSKTNASRFLRFIYLNFIVNHIYRYHKQTLINEANKLFDVMKESMELYT